MARANSWILPRSTCMVTGSPVLPIALLSTGIASSLAVVPNRARECSRRRRGREGLEYHKAIGIDPASDRAGPPRPVGTSRRAFRHEQRQSTTCCLWRFGCGARSGAGLRVEADGGADCQDDPGRLLLDEGQATRADVVGAIAHHTAGVDAGLAVRLDLLAERQRARLPDVA